MRKTYTRILAAALAFFLTIFSRAAIAASGDGTQPANTFRINLDAASMTVTVPQGWEVTEYNAAKRLIIAKNPVTGAELRIGASDLGTGTPSVNFYKMSDQDVKKMDDEFKAKRIPFDIARIGQCAYICGADANPPSYWSCQTRINTTYVSIYMRAQANAVLAESDMNSFVLLLQGMRVRENIFLEMAQGYGFILVGLLWLALAIVALSRLARKYRLPLTLPAQSAERFGRLGGIPLIASIRAALGIAMSIYLLITVPHSKPYLVYYSLCIALFCACLLLLLLRKSRAFPYLYAAGVVVSAVLAMGIKPISLALLILIADPILLLCFIVSKRTAVLFKTRKIEVAPQIEV